MSLTTGKSQGEDIKKKKKEKMGLDTKTRIYKSLSCRETNTNLFENNKVRKRSG